MEQKLPTNQSRKRYLLTSLFIRAGISFLIGLLLFVGGLYILTLDLPGWKLLLGIPSAQFGIIILLLTFDEVTKRKLSPDLFIEASCPTCHAIIFLNPDESEGTCPGCGEPFFFGAQSNHQKRQHEEKKEE